MKPLEQGKLFNKMLYKSNFSIEVAVANCSGAMEADTISKNGRSSKSHTSGINLMKSLFIFCLTICVGITVEAQTYKKQTFNFEYKNVDSKEYYGVSISLTNMTIETINFMGDYELSNDTYKISRFVVNSESKVIGFQLEQNTLKYYSIMFRGFTDDNTKAGIEFYRKNSTGAALEKAFIYLCDLKGFKFDEFFKAIESQTSGNTTTPPSTPTTPLYLSTSISSVNFLASGGTREITVNTNDNDWACSKVSDWCTLTQSDKTIRLVCDANNGNARNDYFLVWYGARGADGKQTQNVRVNVTQDPGVKPPSGKIEKVWLEHNAIRTFTNGTTSSAIKIHVNFTVNNMKGVSGQILGNVYLNGEALSFSALEDITPSYDNSEYNDFVLYYDYDGLSAFLPKDGAKKYDLKLQVTLHNGKDILAYSDYVYFTYSR